MSENKSFIWLLDSGEARNGKRLVKGATHSAADFPADVVAEWIRSGAAKPAAAPIAKKAVGKEE